MKILVTGGAGFIASHLTDKLVAAGNEVVILDNLSTGKLENINKQAKFYQIDITDELAVSDLFEKEKPEIVFHFAAQINLRKSVESPAFDATTNILGSLNLFENCKKFGVKKIIFSSTGGAIYGDALIIPTPETYEASPVSPYGVAKLSVEKYLNYYWEVFGIPFVALRFANVYGPRQNSKGEAGVIAIFCDKIFSNEQPIITGDGLQTRDFIFVLDVVRAAIMAMESDQVGVFNVSTGKETDINTIFSTLNKMSGKNLKQIYGPDSKGEQRRSNLDYSKIKKFFGWEPEYDLETGIKETIDKYINQ